MSWHAKSSYGYARSSQEAYDNCFEIYTILYNLGWTLEAVCGVLGNMESESGYNPWRWQSDIILANDDPDIYIQNGHAYGLCQWDPASKYISNGVGIAGYSPNYSNQAGTASDGHAQMIFMDSYSAQWQNHPSSPWPETFAEYKQLTASVAYCTESWFHNYEIGTWDNNRIPAAEHWYQEFGGITPPTPGLKDDILFLKHFIDQNHKRRYIY